MKKKVKEIPIYESGMIWNVKVQVIPIIDARSFSCDNCAFSKINGYKDCPNHICSASKRKDKTNVFFKCIEVEQDRHCSMCKYYRCVNLFMYCTKLQHRIKASRKNGCKHFEKYE